VVVSTNSLIQLGRRIRDANNPADGAAYDVYRSSFAVPLEEIANRCRDLVATIEESARLKTLESVRAKLLRQQIRLPRIQDIAGLRLVVSDVEAQERLLNLLSQRFSDARIDDYRRQPQNGYRAVHLIVMASSGQPVEVQVRTFLQNAWANTCEALSVAIDPALKYGGGPLGIKNELERLSTAVMDFERSPDIADPRFNSAELLTRLADLIPQHVQ